MSGREEAQLRRVLTEELARTHRQILDAVFHNFEKKRARRVGQGFRRSTKPVRVNKLK